jgi:glutamyl-tRNA synthetase
LKNKVITRFAPSPTGSLHLGGARTALFNYYYAKKMNGDFFIRIEDTDLKRNKESSYNSIIDGLSWLGVNSDFPIIYQKENIKRHLDCVDFLLDNGFAYKCYKDKVGVEYDKKSSAFRSPYRDLCKKDCDLKGKPFVVRFRVGSGFTKIKDGLRGVVSWDNKNIEDFVLVRRDGTPTYMLSVVVDDNDIGVTHIIRGDDHLINAGKQSLIYDAMGWEKPNWIHVPLIHEKDSGKLSKRNNACDVLFYKKEGYLSSSICNYIVNLGWSKDKKEIFLSEKDIINNFSLKGFSKSSANLDRKKLDSISKKHIKSLDDEDFIDKFLEYRSYLGLDIYDEKIKNRLKRGCFEIKKRSANLKESISLSKFFEINSPIALKKIEYELDTARLVSFFDLLILEFSVIPNQDWEKDIISKKLEKSASYFNLSFRDFGLVLRQVISGENLSPDLVSTIYCLGKEETMKRLSSGFYNIF